MCSVSTNFFAVLIMWLISTSFFPVVVLAASHVAKPLPLPQRQDVREVHRDSWISQGCCCLGLPAQRHAQMATLTGRGLLHGTVEDEDGVFAENVLRSFLLQNPVDCSLLQLDTMLQNRLNDVVAKVVPHKISNRYEHLIHQLHDILVRGCMLEHPAQNTAAKSVLRYLDAIAAKLLDDELPGVRWHDFNHLLDHEIAVRRGSRTKHGTLQLLEKRQHIHCGTLFDGCLEHAASLAVEGESAHRALHSHQRFVR